MKGAVTGRMSSSKPNFEDVPTSEESEIRRAFASKMRLQMTELEKAILDIIADAIFEGATGWDAAAIPTTRGPAVEALEKITALLLEHFHPAPNATDGFTKRQVKTLYLRGEIGLTDALAALMLDHDMDKDPALTYLGL